MRFLLLPQFIFQVWAFFGFSVSGNSFLCILRRMFASSDHISLLHVVFSSAIVCACSGVVGSFWLILRYKCLVCINFCILLFSVGSLCICVAFSRSCLMSQFMCLLVGFFLNYVVFEVYFYGFVM